MAEEYTLKSTLPYPAIHEDKKYVVFSDWDGTITTYDSSDYMTDNLGYGQDRRRAANLEILFGQANFRDEFRNMLESIAANGHSFEDCKRFLTREDSAVKLDPGFQEFYSWCNANNVPLIIVSSGMEPTIRAVLSHLVGEEIAHDIDIISNDVELDSDNKWKIQYRHPTSGFGHDKSQAILPYRLLPNPPVLFFFGDGVSDMSAARHADILFAKQKESGENNLAQYCMKERIQHILFRDFRDALLIVQSVVRGEKTVDEVLAGGALS